jgi:hypothetical protein
MPDPTDAQIRAALKSVITTAAPLAVVFDWWVLGAEEDQWAGLLRSSLDASGGRNRVHGYVITRSGSDPNESRAGRTRRDQVRRSQQYTILALHYYDPASMTVTNSDAAFNLEIDAISDALDDLTTVSAHLAKAEPIQWAINLKSYNGELVHIARGVISIPTCT